VGDPAHPAGGSMLTDPARSPATTGGKPSHQSAQIPTVAKSAAADAIRIFLSEATTSCLVGAIVLEHNASRRAGNPKAIRFPEARSE